MRDFDVRAQKESWAVMLCQVHSKPSASRHYARFKQEMLLNLGKVVKAHGADFAWKDHVEFTSGPFSFSANNGNGGGGIEPSEPVEIGLAAT